MEKGSVIGKKGISAVVATVLIVMITVAAIGIIWVAVIPMIKQNLGSSSCNNVDLSIGTTQGYTCYDIAQDIVAVQVKKGSEEFNITGVNFFLLSGGNSYSENFSYSFIPNGYHIFYIDTSNLDSVDTVSLAPILDTDGDCGAISSYSLPSCNLGDVPVIRKCSDVSACKNLTCKTPLCNNQMCEYSFMAQGLNQLDLCIAPKKCDGAGNCVQCLNAGECLPADCRVPTCSLGSCSYFLASEGTSCNGGAGRCNSTGGCVDRLRTNAYCINNEDCLSLRCSNNVCLGGLTGNEEDSGGRAGYCYSDEDCAMGACCSGRCASC